MARADVPHTYFSFSMLSLGNPILAHIGGALVTGAEISSMVVCASWLRCRTTKRTVPQDVPRIKISHMAQACT